MEDAVKPVVTMTDRVRKYALDKGVWIRSDMIRDLGESSKNSIATLIASGELTSPARRVYSLPGIHDRDPRLVQALSSAGSRLYPDDRRIASLAPAERRARRESAGKLSRERPKDAVIAWMTERRAATTAQIREALGPSAARMLAELVEQGRLRRLVTSLYAVADMEPGSDEAEAAISAMAASESITVREIDEAKAKFGTAIDPELTGKAVLKRWRSPPDANGRSALTRIYVEIPGYPTIFAQRSMRKVEGEAGAIAWGGKAAGVGPAMARELAAKVFHPLPTWFWEIEAMTPEEGVSIVPMTIRKDAHVDLGLSEDPTPVDLDYDPRHLLPCAYVIGDTKKLDPERLSHPLPEKVRMLVDHREPASIITALRRVPNLEIVRTELEVGDYMVEGHIVIERKSAPDFMSSIKDGAERLMLQAERMAATGLHRLLMIEGGPYSQRVFNLNRLDSTLSYIRDENGIHIVPTMNQRSTVYNIVQATKHRMFGRTTDLRRPDPATKREVSDDPSGMVRLMLSYLNGVSEERVRALVNHFGTLAAIAGADVAHLREVKGIGRKVADHIHDVFHHRLTLSNPEIV
jgi:ERCC4-type nuclease